MVSHTMVRNRLKTQYAYIGLGSNLGDRKSNLEQARARIELLGLPVVKSSSIYETEPVGYTDQPWFLNQVLKVEIGGHSQYHDSPSTLLRDLLAIESQMGRKRRVRFGPRVIDIDLLLQDGLIENSQLRDGPVASSAGNSSADTEHVSPADQVELILPHPRLHLRRFVLEPMCEIDSDVQHPVLSVTCREMLARLPSDGPEVRTWFSE